MIHSLEIYRFACEATFSGVRAKKKRERETWIKGVGFGEHAVVKSMLGVASPSVYEFTCVWRLCLSLPMSACHVEKSKPFKWILTLTCEQVAYMSLKKSGISMVF